MARKSVFPDSNDRSPNAPSMIASKPMVIGLYNQAHPTNKAERVVESVKAWFVEEAKNTYKWDSATFHGNECVLEVKMTKRKTPQD
jgi:hypothetical protein